jgi:hypothetical protein
MNFIILQVLLLEMQLILYRTIVLCQMKTTRTFLLKEWRGSLGRFHSFWTFNEWCTYKIVGIASLTERNMLRIDGTSSGGRCRSRDRVKVEGRNSKMEFQKANNINKLCLALSFLAKTIEHNKSLCQERYMNCGVDFAVLCQI